jgi:hypothetical protein
MFAPTMARDGAEEQLLFHPGDGPVVQVRSTLIQSSLQSLRARHLGDEYARHLDPRHHDIIFNTMVPVWLPIAVAFAHYEACELLGLTEQEQVDMGSAVSQRVQGGFLRTLATTGRNLGATPWTILMKLGRVWDRTFQGGGYALYKVGPKDARCELLNTPLARFGYYRNAQRGAFVMAASIFAQRAFCSLVPRRSGNDRLAFSIAWA